MTYLKKISLMSDDALKGELARLGILLVEAEDQERRARFMLSKCAEEKKRRELANGQ